MIELGLLALAVGFDNLRAAFALGLGHPSAATQARIVASFAISETVAPIVGVAIGSALVPGVVAVSSHVVAVVALGIAAVLAAWPVLRGRDADSPVDGVWLSTILPIALSFDNVAAGIALGVLGFALIPSALVLGGVSAALSLLGLRAGAAVSSRLPFRPDVVGALALGLAAIVVAAEGVSG
jgi:putative Mn2+ efflux pump MntP